MNHLLINVDNDDHSPKILNLLYSNVRSILSKLDELQALVCDSLPDIVCICESWANPDISNSLLNISNYNIIARMDRTDTSSGIGGGLLIYSKKDLNIF